MSLRLCASVFGLAFAVGLLPYQYPVSTAMSAQTAVKPSSGEPEPGWKNLWDGKTLTGWKSADYYKPGKLLVQDGSIIIEKGMPMTGLVYDRRDFPKMDYEVTLEGKKITGNDFFCTTTFPYGDSFCSLVVGGWGGTTVGLSNVNSADASENETSTSKEFAENRWYLFRIRISRNRIEAWIDKDKTVDLDATDRKINTRAECDECHPFGIATYRTTGAVRNLRVRLLSEAEKKEIAATKPKSND